MSVLVALAALMPGAVACAAPQLLTMAQFRDAYVAELAREYPDDTVTVTGEDQLQITSPLAQVWTAYLDNAYKFYRQDPAHLTDILKRYISIMGETAAEPQISADKLIVLVRPASYAQTQLSMAAAPGQPDFGPLLTRPLAGDLLAFVAVDQPHTYSFPPASVLRKALRLDDAAIFQRALENTERRVRGPASPPPGLFVYTTGAGVASSLVAESDFWDQPGMQIGGAPVIAPVAKDLVIVAHADDASSIASLRKAAAQSATDPNGLTSDLFVRRSGAWVLLPP
jgi:hypothetical protein